MKTIEKVLNENGAQLAPVKAAPIPIPGSGLVSRIFYVPFDLQKTKFVRSLFDDSNRRTETVIVGDEAMEFTLPSFMEVNSQPIYDGTVSSVTKHESFESLASSFQFKASTKVSYGFFSGSAAFEAVQNLNTQRESLYAIRTIFVPEYELVIPGGNQEVMLQATLQDYRQAVPSQALDLRDIESTNEYMRFFEVWGSHFMQRGVVGGQAVVTMIADKESETSLDELSAALEISIKAIAGNGNVSAEAMAKVEAVRNSSGYQFEAYGVGGKLGEIAKLTEFDNEIFANWIDSIPRNPEVIDFELTPLWTVIGGAEGDRLEDAYRTIQENVAFATQNEQLNTPNLWTIRENRTASKVLDDIDADDFRFLVVIGSEISINRHSAGGLWSFTLEPGGFWRITDSSSDLAMTVKDGSCEDGAELVLEYYVGAAHQQFSLKERKSNAPVFFDFTQHLIARHSGKCLRSPSNAECDPVLQQACDVPLSIQNGLIIF